MPLSVSWLCLLACTPREADVDVRRVAPVDRAHHATVAWSDRGPVVALTSGTDAPRVLTWSPDDEVQELAPELDAQKPDVVTTADGPEVAFQIRGQGLWRARPGASARPLAPPDVVRGSAAVDLAATADGLRAVWYDADDLGTASIRGWSDDEVSLPRVVATFDDTVRSAPDVAASLDGATWVAYTEQWFDQPGALIVAVFDATGAQVARWRHEADDPAFTPRRPTVDVGADGRAVVIFRELSSDHRSGGAWLVALDDDAAPLGPPIRIGPATADRPVAVRLGDDAVLAAFENDAHIEVATYAFPGLERLRGPLRVSTANERAQRPHVAADPSGAHAALAYEMAGGQVVLVTITP